MNKGNYDRARWYAFKVVPSGNPLDTVHDCYLSWYNNKGSDLFDQDMALINHTIKMRYYDQKRKDTKFKWRNEVHNKEIISLNVHYDVSGDPVYEIASGISSDDYIIHLDLKNACDKAIQSLIIPRTKRSLIITIYDLILKGYRPIDIEKEVGRGRTTVSTVVNKIKKTLTEVARMREYEPHNPFNSNSLKVIKTLKRNEYDKNIDKYKDFKFDTDLGADSNEHYMLLVNDNKEGLLIRENFKRDVNVFKNR